MLNLLRDPENGKVDRICRFVTAGVMLRLHNFLVDARRQGNVCAGWGKQATFAKVVACFTGILVHKSDAEYIGNAQDCFLRDYSRALAKAHKASRMARSRALKSGKELPSNFGERERELEEQIYQCKFGGVPRDVLIGCASTRIPVHKQPVPPRKVEHAAEANLKMHEEMMELKKQQASSSRDMAHNWNSLVAAVDKEH